METSGERISVCFVSYTSEARSCNVSSGSCCCWLTWGCGLSGWAISVEGIRVVVDMTRALTDWLPSTSISGCWSNGRLARATYWPVTMVGTGVGVKTGTPIGKFSTFSKGNGSMRWKLAWLSIRLRLRGERLRYHSSCSWRRLSSRWRLSNSLAIRNSLARL